MSFDFSSLITDRTQADVSRVEQLAAKIKAGTASESELVEFNSAAMKGAYNYTDLNRVTAAMEALKAKLEGYGYNVPGYQKIEIPHVLGNNSGTTNKLPEGYQRLTYIESSGTQYIDTGFAPNQNTRTVLDIQVINTGSNGAFLGGRTSNSSNMYAMFFLSAGTFRTDYGTKQKSISVSDLTARYLIDKNKTVTSFGEYSATHDASTFTTPCSMALLAVNTNGTVGTCLSAKLYSCQIYDNGTLVRDFVPCINPSGTAGLYDMVNSKFYESVGSGSFVAGDEVATASVSDVPDGATEYDPYTWYEFDWPTPATMALYLQNVSVIRSILTVMATTPEVPANMATLMVQDANDIEAIVLDVYRQLTIMQTTFIPCGGALCGGDNS